MRAKKTSVILPDADKDIDTGSTREASLTNNDEKKDYISNPTRYSPRYNLRAAANQVNNNYITSNGIRDSPPPLPQLIFDGRTSAKPTDSLLGSATMLAEEEHYGSEWLTADPLSESRDNKGSYEEEAWFTNNYTQQPMTDNNELIDQNRNHQSELPNERQERASPSVSFSSISQVLSYHTNPSEQPALSGHQRNHHHSHRRTHSSASQGSHRRCRHSRHSKSSLRSSSSRSSFSLSSYLLSSSESRLQTTEDIAKFIGTLRRERSRLLQEIEQEDEERSSFYTQLDNLNQRLRHLPHDYNVGCERWRVEGEMYRVQEALVERLGSPSVMLRRRENRLHSINAIEKTIQRLRQDNSGLTTSGGISLNGSKSVVPQESADNLDQTMDLLNANEVEMVYGLLSMFSSGDRDDMSRTLLAMSSSPDSCVAMRQSGCLPLLIQLLHGGDDTPPTREARLRAAQALHNIVYSHPDDKRGRREARVLKLLEQIRIYSDYLYDKLERICAGRGPLLEDDMDRHPCPAMAALMKLSFDEDHRHAMCTLGGLHAIAELIRRDHEAHGSTTSDQYCITLRRYAGMALTNLTFGDGTNKALLCSFRFFMKSLVSQLHSPSEDLRQVTASVLRNLSWRADSGSKTSLREVGAVTSLMLAALTAKKESTLKVILSAVWNLSAHCSMNKSDICNVDGALAFVCSTLTYKSQSRTLAIVENGGGILRNISSHIAVRDDLRQVLRDHSTLSILLAQLRSPSLTVVSNACGTLWNLSARCQQDQAALWELGAVPMLRSLMNSKHKMISMGSSAALKNLLQARPEGMSITDSRHGLGLPGLQARKQKALEQELDPSLAETCDNIETSPRSSPTTTQPLDPFYGQLPPDGLPFIPNGRQQLYHSLGPQFEGGGLMSESRETIASTHSDNSHDRMRHLMMKQKNSKTSFVEGVDGEPLELSVTSMAPPTHGMMDVAHLSQEDIQTQDISSSTNEIFAARMKATAKDAERSGPSDHRSMDEPHHSVYSKYVNHSRNIADVDIGDNLHQKVTHIENKYRNGSKAEKSDHGSSKTSDRERPSPQVNNYMQGKKRTDSKQTAKLQPGCDGEDDQPTDFTLTYHEGHPSEARKKNYPRGSGSSRYGAYGTVNLEDDSVRTFCTEGTPYSNSNATSMSDLRDSESGKKERKDSLPTEEAIDIEIENLEDLDIDVNKLDRRRIRPKDASKGRNADGTVRYFVEGTPVSLSRFSSVSSLSSDEINEHIDKELLEDEEETEPLEEFENETEMRSLAKVKESQSTSESPGLHAAEGSPLPEEKPTEYCNETPLMFSRTTSVSSLSSFDIHSSIHDDRSSVVSDLSRFTSGAISPSDLPDSPSLTVPTSPKRNRVLCTGLKPPQLPAPRQNGSFFRDSAKAYVVEDTPAEISRGTSLSSLTFDDEMSLLPRSRGDGKDSSVVTSESESSLPAPTVHQSRPINRSSIPRLHSHSRDSETRSRSIEVRSKEISPAAKEGGKSPDASSEGGLSSQEEDDRRLAALIQSGMSSARRSTKAPIASPVAAPRAAFSSNRHQLAIPPPPPPPPVPSDGDSSRPSAIPIKTPNLTVTVEAICISGSDEPQCSFRDSLLNFCTEDTPRNISQSGSVSDLSVLSMPGERNSGVSSDGQRSPNPLPYPLEETVEDMKKKKLLEKCIQSGMPKPRSNIKSKDVRQKDKVQLPSYLPPTDHFKGPALSPRRPPNQRPVPVARVTPAVKVGIVSPQPKSFGTRRALDAAPIEEVMTYAVEGTPAHFSPASSLSDLTVESMECAGSTTPAFNRSTKIPTTSPQHKGKGKSIPSPFSRDSTPQRAPSERGSSSGRTPESDEVPKKFNVEDTPSRLSRQSSLSSISMEDKEVAVVRRHPKHESLRSFNVEGTPACFSRNSSLSSLSLESYGDETTAREQALLQNCINQGMPKSKSDLGDVVVGAPKNGGSRIPAPMRSPIRVQSGLPSGQLKLVPHNSSLQQASTSRASVTKDDAESCKLRTETEQNEKEQAYAAIKSEDSFLDEASLTEDLTLRTEVDSELTNATLRSVLKEKHFPVSADNELTSEESAVTVVKADKYVKSISRRDASPLCEQKQSSPVESKISSSDESGNKGMEKSSPSCSGSLEDKVSDCSISEAGIVAVEALRLAKEVANEAQLNSSDDVSQMSQSFASMSDFYLEQIKPPSAMGSLVSLSNSMTSSADEAKLRGANGLHSNGRRLECRHTKKLPEMVRRALGDQDGGGSLASSCHSNLDNIPPPSMMMEDDMESSMISVASITSEVVEPRESPPSMTASMASENMSEIIGPAQHIANILMREYKDLHSSATLVAGDDGSTYQEITDFEHDETLGAPQLDHTASDTEMVGEEFQQDVPDLPFDSPVRGSPRGTARGRSTVKDRFRSRTSSNSSADSNRSHSSSKESSPRLSKTPKQRRAENADRFKTRTISVESEEVRYEREESREIANFPTSFGKIVPTNRISSNLSPVMNGSRRSFRQRRLENPSRYQTRTIDVPLSSLTPQEQDMSDSDFVEFQDNDELSLTPEQLEALSQDANIIICSLNENRESMMVDPASFITDDGIMDIETLSLISMDDEEVLHRIDEEEAQLPVFRRPRIIKPGEESICRNQEDMSIGKGIRGRRKALFTIGRHQGHVPCSVKGTATSIQPAPPVRTGGPVVARGTQPGSPKLPRATRASTLRQNSSKVGSSVEESGRATGSSPGSSAGSSPRLGSNVRTSANAGKASKAQASQGSPPYLLRRQNTFTKEDGEADADTKQTKSDGKKGSTSQPRGLPKGKLRKDSVQPTPNPAIGGNARSGCREWSPTRGRQSQSKSVSLTRDVKPPTVMDIAEWDKDSQNKPAAKTGKKNVTSRIANLWKRVEKAQTAKPKEKDGRVWITSTKTSSTPETMVRSSTFEKLQSTKDAVEKIGKSKLGLRFGRLKGRNTKSSPPSGATTPVDPRPQCLVSPTRVTAPRVRPATHPPSSTPTSCSSVGTPTDDGRTKRLSRLGSFIVVAGSEEETGRVRSPPISAVAPFNYKPSNLDREPSLTRIPQPSKPVVNIPRDDNGNATYV